MSRFAVKRPRARFNLWHAFSAGILISAILWFAVHGAAKEDGRKNSHTSGVVEYGMQDISQPQAKTIPHHNSGVKPETPKVRNNAEGKELTSNQSLIKVYLSKSRSIETVPLETYVKGVVAAEMPLDFEPAALQAQAIAARTYIIRRMRLNDHSGMPVINADVTDTQSHQVYRSLNDMRMLQRENKAGWSKVNDAVEKTAGEVITYGGELIEALFFSTSNGRTENSEEVFPNQLPYLRSVASPWDKQESPRAEEAIEMPLKDFYAKLGVGVSPASINLAGTKPIRILEWTAGKRVKLMVAGNKKLTGEEVRNKLGLRSASFDWKIGKNKITLKVYGSGHGVGMSQWGAEGMAKAGKSAYQIIAHYYTGARTEKVSKLANGS
ncbi:stage II sporulation protein D [Cohnella luojiensis]|uniref:Stage II sporulation protein D n=1 Tax=Cohnella luojiensis TaxID=652876 RepID=A0A4Y8M6G3_9BACL|nr:stage II sporulation protein D [Cohnella luojiensis]TFE28984.1 stage II sporulation protein D [Cohnella luojiensis]